MKASVIIPAYNAEKAISDCLSALKRQTKKPLEVIVVDDGSADRTAEVSRKLGAKVISQRNRGPAAARNMGSKAARGDILLFTDADCVPDKNWVGEMLRPFSDRGVSGVQGAYRTRQKSLVARFCQAEIEDRYRRMSQGDCIDFIGTYAAAYRKSVFSKFGGFDKSFPKASGEDPELSFRMAARGHKLVFNRKAIVYHTHPDSLTRYLKQKYWRAYWRVLLYKKHPKKAVKDSYTPQSLKVQIGLVCLFLASIATLPFIGPVPAAALLLLLFITTLPFSASSRRMGAGVALVSPIMLMFRSAVFGLGLLSGSIRGRSG